MKTATLPNMTQRGMKARTKPSDADATSRRAGHCTSRRAGHGRPGRTGGAAGRGTPEAGAGARGRGSGVGSGWCGAGWPGRVHRPAHRPAPRSVSGQGAGATPRPALRRRPAPATRGSAKARSAVPCACGLSLRCDRVQMAIPANRRQEAHALFMRGPLGASCRMSAEGRRLRQTDTPRLSAQAACCPRGQPGRKPRSLPPPIAPMVPRCPATAPA